MHWTAAKVCTIHGVSNLNITNPFPIQYTIARFDTSVRDKKQGSLSFSLFKLQPFLISIFSKYKWTHHKWEKLLDGVSLQVNISFYSNYWKAN